MLGGYRSPVDAGMGIQRKQLSGLPETLVIVTEKESKLAVGLKCMFSL